MMGASLPSAPIRSANTTGVSDCAPSLSAFSGRGCTSIMAASAPAANAARVTAGTSEALPVLVLRRPAVLQHDRSLHRPDLTKQVVILGVSCPDLEDISVFADDLDIANVHHLGNDRHTGLGAGSSKHLERLHAVAVERIRR